MNIYDFKFKTIVGKEISLEQYKGKALLIVNIASKCGFTPQLEDLQKIYEKYQSKGLEILGFPCNQFALQSPETNQEMQEFCKFNYGVTFQLSGKIDVIGEHAHPLYQYLTQECPFEGFDMSNGSDKMLRALLNEEMPENVIGDTVKWNFTKFLVNPEGKVVKRFESSIEPMDMIEEINSLLA